MFDKAKRTMVPQERCTTLKAECCKSKPWPEVPRPASFHNITAVWPFSSGAFSLLFCVDLKGAPYRYPYKADPNGTFAPHFVQMWPFGGEGYVLSRGLLNAIGADYWERCMFASFLSSLFLSCHEIDGHFSRNIFST
jgi:hypothetical protein